MLIGIICFSIYVIGLPLSLMWYIKQCEIKSLYDYYNNEHIGGYVIFWPVLIPLEISILLYDYILVVMINFINRPKK